ncbi:NAD(P)H-binding protein [Algoriphagus sp.]|uniref:NAD(P)H-binding protein n=1 Tax=Algoriphagus sp. TaxID=1872435 RepID=UPI0025D839D4|nr:NAD(P)H-binding protein [Algoriphagus sp.]
MKTFNTIAVIGGTGKSGTYLVKELLRRDYNVRLLVRNPKKVPDFKEKVDVIFGDASSKSQIHELLKGADAVISCLGLGIPLSSKTIFKETTENVVNLLKARNKSRYIILSGLHVDTEMDQKGDNTKAATAYMYSNYPVSTQNKQDEYELLRDSNIQWTLVRSSYIELTDHKSEYCNSIVDCLGQKISASSLAEFLVDQLESNEYLKKAPFIWNK